MHKGNRVSKGTVLATLRGEHFESTWLIDDRVDVEVFNLTIQCNGFAGHALDDATTEALDQLVVELQDFLDRKRDSFEFKPIFGLIFVHIERGKLGAASLSFRLRNGEFLLEGSADLDDGYLRDFLTELRRGWQARV